MEWPVPEPVINEVVVQFMRRDHLRRADVAFDLDRSPRSRPDAVDSRARAGRSGHRPRRRHDGAVGGTAAVRLTDPYRAGGMAEYVAIETRNLVPPPGHVDSTVGVSLPMPGLNAWRDRSTMGSGRGGVPRDGAAGQSVDGDAADARSVPRHGTGRAADPSEGARLRRDGVVDLRRRAWKTLATSPGARRHRWRHREGLRKPDRSRRTWSPSPGRRGAPC